MKIVFAGTPHFALPPLNALAASLHDVVAVYTQPDRPKGRGRKIAASPVKERALALGMPIVQPPTLKDETAQQALAAFEPDLMVVVAYGLLLPPAVLAIPKNGCVNIHASLLPRWRGAAPIQHALLAGDTKTGVSIMQMDAGLDTGPVLSMRDVVIAPNETAGELHDRLSIIGADALMEAIVRISRGDARTETQDDTLSTYAPKIRRKDARIDWTKSAADIQNKVCAFNPVPGAETRLDGQQLKIWRAAAIKEGSGEPGAIVEAGAGGIVVATGGGLLRIESLQLAGRTRVSASDFTHAVDLNGKILDPR